MKTTGPIVILVAVKNTKVVGVISIIFSLIILVVTNVWRLVVSALLLAGGVVVLVYKTKSPRSNPDTGDLIIYGRYLKVHI